MKSKLNPTQLLALALVLFLTACAAKPESLVTQTYTLDDKKFIVQKLPADFNNGEDENKTGFRYYRLLIETPGKFTDTADVNYINFGMEHQLRLVKQNDSIPPAFMQRMANGRETMYEYIVAFEDRDKQTPYEIYMNDQVFGLGKVSVKF